MTHRYTMDELENESDIEILFRIVRDRQSTCTNYYTPLYQRLSQLLKKLEKGQPLTKPKK